VHVNISSVFGLAATGAGLQHSKFGVRGLTSACGANSRHECVRVRASRWHQTTSRRRRAVPQRRGRSPLLAAGGRVAADVPEDCAQTSLRASSAAQAQSSRSQVDVTVWLTRILPNAYRILKRIAAGRAR